MRLPQQLNVLDNHGGFTARMRNGDTLWRPGSLLKRKTVGTLVAVNEHTFYQMRDDVTMGTYKVTGYPYLVNVWFDNPSGQRLA